MQKTDVKELRKYLKKAPNQDGIIDWMYGFYVSEGEVVCENIQKFYNYTEEEKFRLSDIVNKTVSALIGKDMFPVDTEQNEAIMGYRMGDTDEVLPDLQAFRDVVVSQYSSNEPFFATVARVLYDAPVKASDGAILEDEHNSYDAIVFSISPAKLSTPALGIDDGTVTDLVRRWTIGTPVCGFLYPSFDDRSSNVNEVSLFMKKHAGEELLRALFEIEEETPDSDEQKKMWNDILTEVGVTSEEVSTINELVCELSEESAFLGKDALKKVVEEAGVDKDKFENVYESIAGDTELPSSVIANAKIEIKTDSAKIQVNADKAAFVKTKKIDGIEYVIIPLDGVMTVNGASVLPSDS